MPLFGKSPAPLLLGLAGVAVLSGVGNGIALKNGTFVLSRLEAEGHHLPRLWTHASALDFAEGGFGAALYLGMLIAALFAGEVAHRLGRRVAIVLGELWVALTSLVSMAIPSAEWAPAWRLALGVGIGFCVIGKPLYLAETAPIAHRGRILGLFALSFPVGYLLMELLDYVPDGGDGSRRGWWRLEIGVGAIAPVCLLLLMRHMPESPAFAATPGAAPGSAPRSGGGAKTAPEPRAEAPDEAAALVPRSAGETDAQAAARHEARRNRAAAGLLAALTLAVEGCGTAGITQFSKDMYGEVRAERGGDSMQADAFYGSVYALLCLAAAATVIALIDSHGRRPLMIGGLGGLVVCWAGYAATTGRVAAWALVASSLPSSFIASTYFALAPELLPPRRRARLLGAVFAAKFGLAAATCFVWPVLRRTIGRRPLYAGYAAIALSMAAYLAAYLPETKGRSLHDIWRDLR